MKKTFERDCVIGFTGLGLNGLSGWFCLYHSKTSVTGFKMLGKSTQEKEKRKKAN